MNNRSSSAKLHLLFPNVRPQVNHSTPSKLFYSDRLSCQKSKPTELNHSMRAPSVQTLHLRCMATFHPNTP